MRKLPDWPWQPLKQLLRLLAAASLILLLINSDQHLDTKNLARQLQKSCAQFNALYFLAADSGHHVDVQISDTYNMNPLGPLRPQFEPSPFLHPEVPRATSDIRGPPSQSEDLCPSGNPVPSTVFRRVLS